MLLAAVLADNFYNDPRVTFVFLGVSVVPLFHALANPRFFEFERNLDFSKQFWVGAADKLIGVAVSILHRGGFSHILGDYSGLVVGTFAQILMSWVLRPYRPRLTFHSIRDVGGFTGWLAGISFVAALNNKLDILFSENLSVRLISARSLSAGRSPRFQATRLPSPSLVRLIRDSRSFRTIRLPCATPICERLKRWLLSPCRSRLASRLPHLISSP